MQFSTFFANQHLSPHSQAKAGGVLFSIRKIIDFFFQLLTKTMAKGNIKIFLRKISNEWIVFWI